MEDLQIFNYYSSNIRIVYKDNEPWFVAKDVCGYFDDAHYRRSVARLDEDEKGVTQIGTPGGKQNMLIINESGVYSLLFNMQPQKANLSENDFDSRVNKIRMFRRWVTHDVLPTIRRTGGYGNMIPQTYGDALILAGEKQKQIEVQANLIAQQSKRIEADKPKVDFFKAVTGSDTTISMGDVAKTLNMGIGQNNLFKLLRDNKILMHNNRPFQEYVDRGYFRTIEQSYTVPCGEIRINIKTVVFQKGLAYIRKMIEKVQEGDI